MVDHETEECLAPFASKQLSESLSEAKYARILSDIGISKKTTPTYYSFLRCVSTNGQTDRWMDKQKDE